MDMILGKLVNAFGVSGYEEGIKKVIKEELKDVSCDIKEDRMGNLIVKVGSGKEKVMICSNMDQAGIIVTYIEKNGFLRVSNVGDMKASSFLNNFVIFQNGTMGKIASSKSNPEMADLFVDLGISKEEDVREKIREGDVACLIGDILEVEDKVMSPGLNNRIGCYVLLQAIKSLDEIDKEIYFVFSAQGELGGRGARAAAYSIDPDYSIVLNVQEAGDYIGADGNVELEKGPIIRIKDRNLIMDEEIKNRVEDAAKKAEVKVQYGVSKESTDGGMIHKERSGIPTGVLAVPIRYANTISEMISMKDVESTVKLLGEVLK